MGPPRPRKRELYKPKNNLKRFPSFAIGGKYLWRRYEIFVDYLKNGCSLSDNAVEQVITRYQEYGVPNHEYGDLKAGLDKWKGIRNKIRAEDAASVRWDKAKKKKSKKRLT